jgi:hypothetical protein
MVPRENGETDRVGTAGIYGNHRPPLDLCLVRRRMAGRTPGGPRRPTPSQTGRTCWTPSIVYRLGKRKRPLQGVGELSPSY